MLTALVLVLVPLLAWLALCLLMFVAQRKLVYLPEYTRVPAAQTDYALARDDVALRGWIVNPGQDAAIVYFGGNGEAVEGNRADFARWFPHHTIYLLAYRGYGASDGTPSMAALLGDALAFFDDVQARHPGQPVAAIGRSLGSGIASHVAANRPVGRLVLVTPFDSLSAVGQAHYRWLPVRWLLREDYPSAQWIRQYRGPLLILRAGQDSIIPAANTAALVRSVPRAQVVVIDDAGHNDIQAYPRYASAMRDFLE